MILRLARKDKFDSINTTSQLSGGIEAPEVFDDIGAYIDYTRDLIMRTDVIPYDVAMLYEHLSFEDINRMSEVEWEIKTRKDIHHLYGLLTQMVNGNMKLWHLWMNNEFKHIFTDYPDRYNGSLVILSHCSLYERLVCDKFNFSDGTDGSLGPVRDF